jgi:uncharacterized protein
MLTIRRLLIDLESSFPRRWAGGDAFLTAWFNALSMSFPEGEQFFINSVREGYKALPAPQQSEFEEAVRGFVGQEATHRRLHSLYNAQLTAQGLINHWEPRIRTRTARLAGADPRHALAITAANEHFTALLAHHLLTTPALLQGAEPRLELLWQWHSAEECEHRSVAFDLYRALGGNLRWQRRWMVMVTLFLLTDTWRQTLHNLWRDGALFAPSTWVSATRFLFGAQGIVRLTFKPWAQYFRKGFHPEQQDERAALHWLAHHGQSYTAVGAKTATQPVPTPLASATLVG